MKSNITKLGVILLLVSQLSANQVPDNLVQDFVDSPIKAAQSGRPWKFMEEMFITRPDAKKKLFAVNKSTFAKGTGNVVGGAVGGGSVLLGGMAIGVGAGAIVKAVGGDGFKDNFQSDKMVLGGAYGMAIGVPFAAIASILTSYVGYKTIKHFLDKSVDLETFKSFVKQWPSNKIATPECFQQAFDAAYDQYMKLKAVSAKKLEDKTDTSNMTKKQLKKHEKKLVTNQVKLDGIQLKLNMSKTNKYFAALAPKMLDKIRQSIYAEFPKAYGDRLKAKSDIAENGSTYWKRVRPNSKLVKIIAGTALLATPILIVASGLLAVVIAKQSGGQGDDFTLVNLDGVAALLQTFLQGFSRWN